MSFVSLHNHSGFSILDSTISVKNLVSLAKKNNMSSIALTDTANMYGTIDFYKECKHAGIKPIIGCETWIALNSRFEKKRIGNLPLAFPIVLLVKNKIGYTNLCKISSIGFLEGFYYYPRIDKEILSKHFEGLICLSGPINSSINYHILNSSDEEIKQEILFFKNLFKEDFYFEVQNHESNDLERDSKGIPRYKIPNPKRKVYPSNEYFFKNEEEMKILFKGMEYLLANTLEVASKCVFEFDFKTTHYPIFTFENSQNEDDRKKKAEKFLLDLCENAIPLKYNENSLKRIKEKQPNKDPMQIVRDRLKLEFDLITSKGMVDYFLIVYDFIAWAKKNHIPVGPGRGSAAGSIISFLIGITDIEPLRFNLFFERFINPERLAYPDIDVDICMERRNEVIDYVVNKYGNDKVAQIITFGTMKAKMAIKDVGRVLSVALSKVNEIAKLVPEDPTITLEKALNIDLELKKIYETDKEAKQIIDIAKSIEGSIRNTSTHAAGIIVSADPLTDNIPICIAKDSNMAVTQFSIKPVEAVGLLKIDFLGLKTLTSIQMAVDAIKVNHGVTLD